MIQYFSDKAEKRDSKLDHPRFAEGSDFNSQVLLVTARMGSPILNMLELTDVSS